MVLISEPPQTAKLSGCARPFLAESGKTEIGQLDAKAPLTEEFAG